MGKVTIGEVEVWPTKLTLREQCKKVMEEVMEVFAEVQQCERAVSSYYIPIYDECADVITATCNLLALTGVTDFTEFMEDCARRNHERGRL